MAFVLSAQSGAVQFTGRLSFCQENFSVHTSVQSRHKLFSANNDKSELMYKYALKFRLLSGNMQKSNLLTVYLFFNS